MPQNIVVQQLNDARFQLDPAETIAQTRIAFPDNTLKLAVLTKQTGQLAEVLLDHRAGTATAADIWRQAVQVAAMAARIATEGDSSFPFQGRESD